MTSTQLRSRWSRLAPVPLLLAVPLVAACAGTQKPVVYPNAKAREAGKEQMDRDMRASVHTTPRAPGPTAR